MVAPNEPFTCSLNPGEVVPIPTLVFAESTCNAFVSTVKSPDTVSEDNVPTLVIPDCAASTFSVSPLSVNPVPAVRLVSSEMSIGSTVIACPLILR